MIKIRYLIQDLSHPAECLSSIHHSTSVLKSDNLKIVIEDIQMVRKFKNKKNHCAFVLDSNCSTSIRIDEQNYTNRLNYCLTHCYAVLKCYANIDDSNSIEAQFKKK